MGSCPGLELRPGQQGLPRRVGEVPVAAARPSRAGAVSGAAQDPGRFRRDGVGNACVGGSPRGPPAGAVLGGCRRLRRPRVPRRAAARAACRRGRRGPVGAAPRRRLAGSQDRARRTVGPGAVSGGRGLSRRRRAAPAPGPRGVGDRRSLAGRAVPSTGAGAGGGGDGELLLALECEADGLTRRDLAMRLWKPEHVESEYYPGSWMEARVKRRYSRARALLKHYRDIATGGRDPGRTA